MGQGYPTSRRGNTVYRPADARSNKGDIRRSNEWRRVERDARDYTRTIDRELRLDSRQERQIQEILENQTYQLLRGARNVRDLREAYPFPRRLRQTRYSNRTVERFWRDADSRIERVLNRQQTREYLYLTGRARDRGTRGQRDRHDDRYDDRRGDRKNDRREDRRDDRRRD